jgi:hypothetical protein
MDEMGELEWNRPLEHVSVVERIILKLMLKK